MHDAFGREVKVGDIVMVPFKVLAVYGSAEACNMQLDSVATMPPFTYGTGLTANTKQALRANAGDDVAFVAVELDGQVNLAKPA